MKVYLKYIAVLGVAFLYTVPVCAETGADAVAPEFSEMQKLLEERRATDLEDIRATEEALLQQQLNTVETKTGVDITPGILAPAKTKDGQPMAPANNAAATMGGILSAPRPAAPGQENQPDRSMGGVLAP